MDFCLREPTHFQWFLVVFFGLVISSPLAISLEEFYNKRVEEWSKIEENE